MSRSGPTWTPADYAAHGWVRRTLRMRQAVAEALARYQAAQGGASINDALASLLGIRPDDQEETVEKQLDSENRPDAG